MLDQRSDPVLRASSFSLGYFYIRFPSYSIFSNKKEKIAKKKALSGNDKGPRELRELRESHDQRRVGWFFFDLQITISDIYHTSRDCASFLSISKKARPELLSQTVIGDEEAMGLLRDTPKANGIAS